MSVVVPAYGARATLSRVLAALEPILEDPERGKIGHHLKYDAHVLANHNIELAGMRFDTMLESYVLNSVAARHDMQSTAQCYLGIKKITYEDVAGKGAVSGYAQLGFVFAFSVLPTIIFIAMLTAVFVLVRVLVGV